jgi:hypothetical protein
MRWFNQPEQELIEKEIRFIDAWLTAVERLIRITKREKRQRPRNSIIMERFLNLNKQQPIRTKPAKQKPRKYIQELQPD